MTDIGGASTRQLDVNSIVQKCVRAQITLPFVITQFDRETATDTLSNATIRASKPWFINRFLNSQDEHGNTAVHICCMRADTELCKFLIGESALLNVLNHEHQTPLDICVQTQNHELAKLLLHNKAIAGPQFFENPMAYKSMLSAKNAGLFDGRMDSAMSGTLVTSYSMHLYERPMQFTAQGSYSLDFETLSDVVSNISSARGSNSPLSAIPEDRNMGPVPCVSDFFNWALDL